MIPASGLDKLFAKVKGDDYLFGKASDVYLSKLRYLLNVERAIPTFIEKNGKSVSASEECERDYLFSGAEIDGAYLSEDVSVDQLQERIEETDSFKEFKDYVERNSKTLSVSSCISRQEIEDGKSFTFQAGLKVSAKDKLEFDEGLNNIRQVELGHGVKAIKGLVLEDKEHNVFL